MSSLLSWVGPLSQLPAPLRTRLLRRGGPDSRDLSAQVARQLERVRTRGDAALLELIRRFDGVTPGSLEVPRARWEEALGRTDRRLLRALNRAVRNLTRFHAAQRPTALSLSTEPGIRVGRRPDPLARVGVYAPGGRASYPSSVLMGAVPARVAGVGEVILCSPPQRTGLPSDAVLAAAAIGGVSRVFAVGGAGAIAAMAYGTRTVPAVDRIVGPGNAWVAEAKRQVQGKVAIDAPAGPSELLLICDGSADPATVARELLAQAEHDPEACVLALAVGARKACAIVRCLEEQATAAARGEIVRAALRARGAVLWIPRLSQAWPFVEEFAPEHLSLLTRTARQDLAKVRNAGTVFLGASSSVAHGDYLTGANHVLPTGGLSRSFSGLGLDDFYRWTSWQQVLPRAAARLADDVGLLATAEGLLAHAAAARAWRNP